MTPATLTMRQAAEAAGLGYERFRKVWRQVCHETGFPAPFRGRLWDAAAVAAWRQARSQRPITLPAPARNSRC